jgi:hypothetical protein
MIVAFHRARGALPRRVAPAILAALLVAGVCGSTARAAPVSTLAPAAAAGARSGTGDLAGHFASPEQTIEYHFMLGVVPPREDSLAQAFETGIARLLRDVAEVGPLGARQACGYVDSKRRGLWRHHLIVRVRDGQITVKARAPSPGHLVDLEYCASRKYELDRFEAPEYSISSDLRFGPDQGETRPVAGPATRVWERIARGCPDLWRQIQPVVTSAGDCGIPGVAHTYTAGATLRDPTAPRLKEASVTVWFFPPTDRTLVELAFTGYVRDRQELDRTFSHMRASLRAAGLLQADQTSKTQQYFASYSARGHLAPRD